MDKFANIGKIVIVPALGIQKNYSETRSVEVPTLDFTNTRCSNCINKSVINAFPKSSTKYQQACDNCNSCPYKSFTNQIVTETVYHNEKNKYGYKPMLKANGIKLLLLLHFYHPDRHGIIENLDILDLAKQLHCNPKTVMNNLELLTSYSYIDYVKTEANKITVIINNFENYYLPANKGGRGFIVLSRELLNNLIAIKSLVALRIYLRELINLDQSNYNGIVSIDSVNIKDIKRGLPDYCKPCIIKSSLKTPTEIFKVNIDQKIVKFTINERFLAKKQKENLTNEYIKMFTQFVMDFNRNIPIINSSGQYDKQFEGFFKGETSESGFKLLKFTPKEIENISRIAIHYSYDYVIDVLQIIYKSYYLTDRQNDIKDVGALINSLLRNQFNNKNLAA